MTRLFIDDKEAVISPETNFKITRENPYFNQASSYTNEIELPTTGCIENQRIFGAINRLDVKKEKLAYNARLTVNNEVVLMGTATIIEVTEYSVKIQIVSGVSEMNFRSRFEELYIDELDLGDAMQGMEVYDKAGNIVEGEVPKDWDSIVYWLSEMPINKRIGCIFGTSDKRNWVMLPAMDKKTEKVANAFEDAWDVEGKTTNYPSLYITTRYNPNMAPQPYWCFLIEQVIKACGYKVKANQMRKSEMKNFYFPNATHTIYYAEMLPHMTVSDFITAIENYFGLVVIVDEEKENEVTIYLKENCFEIGTEHLKKVKDEFNVEINDDEEADLSKSNIKYKGDIEDDLIHYLSDEINETAQVVVNDSGVTSDAKSFFINASVEDKRSTIYECSGHHYIYYEGVARECDQMRPLIRGKDNTEIELSIEPAVMTSVMRSFSIPAPLVESKSRTDAINIEEVIKGESLESNKFQHLYVAIFDGYENAERDTAVKITYGDKTFYEYPVTPFGWTYGFDDVSGNGFRTKDVSMMLNKVSGYKTMYDMVYGKITNIDTKKTYEITFYDDKYCSPINTYIIKGKKYACNKIEYKVTLKGMNKEKVGTFYLLPE